MEIYACSIRFLIWFHPSGCNAQVVVVVTWSGTLDNPHDVTGVYLKLSARG